MEKVCRLCGVEKDWKEFSIHPYYHTPVHRCKECCALKVRQYRKENKEKYNKHERDYYHSHKEKKTLVKQKGYKKHRDSIVKNNEIYRLKRMKSLEGRQIIMFLYIKARVTRNTGYIEKGRKLLFTRKEFLNWIQLNWDTYERMFNTWKENNFARGFTPTIDRINNSGNYSLDNIQLLTQSENSKKARRVDYPLAHFGRIY